MIVLISAGNLAISQAVRSRMNELGEGESIWSAQSMDQAASIVGDAVRAVYDRDHKALSEFGIDFNCSFILGGQIRGEPCRLFQIYAAGNFIESQSECPYFQIGESKYGKPILDRVVRRGTPLDEAVKCVLISMDSTLKSNISVGMPLDLLVYKTDDLAVSRFVSINDDDAYFAHIRSRWGALLREAFHELPEPDWSQMDPERSRPIFDRHIRSMDQ